MRLRIVTILMFIICSVPLWADVIYTKNGEQLSGQVLRITDKAVEYNPDGDIPFDLIKITEVEKIQFSNGEIRHIADDLNKKKVNDYNKGVNRHDGFYMRLLFGSGYMTSTTESEGDKYKINSESVLNSFSFGYTFADSIIVFADTRFEATTDIKIKNNGRKIPKRSSDAGVGLFDEGLGLCWYPLLTNMYFSGEISLHTTTYTNIIERANGNIVEDSNGSGLGFVFTTGYEWWISENWGLGIALYFYLSNTKLLSSSFNHNSNGFINRSMGIAFSATYN